MKFFNKCLSTVFLFLFGFFTLVFAFDFGSGKDDYLELSEIKEKQILISLPNLLEKKWIQSFNSSAFEDATAASFLKNANILSFWSYALGDLPADVTVAVLKSFIGSSYANDQNLEKEIIRQIEAVSVDEAVRIAKEKLFANQAKVSFGAMRGMNSKDNKETIFQYVIVYQSKGNGKGTITVRFYSPKEILPPETKTSYGSSLGFVNMLESNEKLKPFIFEIKGDVEDSLSGSYRFNSSSIETKVSFSNNVPDLGLAPSSWYEKYIVNPVNDFVKSIPFVSGFFNNGETTEYLSGSGNSEKIQEEISSIMSDKANASVIENNHPVEEKKAVEEKKNDNNDDGVKKTDDKKKESDLEKEKAELALKEKKLKEQQEKEKLEREKEEKKKQQEEEKEKEKIKKEEEKKLKEEKEKNYATECQRGASESGRRGSIVFNEIAWMGTKSDSSHEWIELKNIGNKSVDIDGWKIYSKNSKKDIIFNKSYVVDPGGFVLLERSEKSLPNIKADFIFGDSINNKEEKLLLYDSACILQDSANGDPDWPAGSNSEKRSMEMSGDFTWHTYSGGGVNDIFGTPKAENSGYDSIVEGRVKSKPSTSSNVSSSGSSGGGGGGVSSGSNGNTLITYCSQANLASSKLSPVVINEVAWMGTGVSSSNEWIELRNITSEEVSLSGWQLLDKNNDIKVVFGAGDKIIPNGFYLLERTDDNSVLNVKADKTYTGALSDKNESLRLLIVDAIL